MARPRRRSHRRKFVWIAAFCALALFVVLPAVALSYLFTADLRPLVQRLASEELGRPVRVGDLRLAWGRVLKLEVRDLRIANDEASDWPDMLRIGRLTAVVYLPALLRGIVQYDVLRLEGSELFLERWADGRRNWRFGGGDASASAATAAGLALIPKNRRQFPDVRDLLLRDLLIVYHSEGRREIRVGLDEVKLAAPDGESEARLTARGAYNDIPLQLDVAGASYEEMRDASRPYVTAFTAASGTAVKLDFKGGIDEPLDFDGVSGAFSFDAQDFSAFLKLFGYERPLAFPVRFDAGLTRDGDLWALDEVQGQFGDSRIAGRFAFDEGARGAPDAAKVDVTLDSFDIKTLAEGIAEPDKAGDTPESFRPDPDPATTLEATIASKSATFGEASFDDLRLHGRMIPGEISTDGLSFGFAGGRIEGTGSLRAEGENGVANVKIDYAGADVARLARMAGIDDALLQGRLDGRLALAMAGKTAREALAASGGQAVLAVKDGQISRSILEKASLDLRSIFRRNESVVPLHCLLMVADIQKGNARIFPLSLRTADARFVGGGALDMPSGQIDLTLRSDPKTTGSLALDWPLHVAGRIDAPTVTPRPGAAPAWLSAPQDLPARLPADMRALAAGTGCSQ